MEGGLWEDLPSRFETTTTLKHVAVQLVPEHLSIETDPLCRQINRSGKDGSVPTDHHLVMSWIR